MKWKVVQEWHYTAEVEVEADTEIEALRLSDGMDGTRVYDDHLYDSTVYPWKGVP